jgi:AhpD family alkylhydroperoxidase
MLAGLEFRRVIAMERVQIDTAHPAAYRAAVKWATSVGHEAEQAGLDRKLVELVNVRVSQINGCATCLDVHVRRAVKAGESERRLGVLAAWRSTELFTDAERAALTLAESVTLLGDDFAQDRAYAAAAEVLTQEQLSAVTWVAIAINAFNRISIISQHPVVPR